MTDWDRYYERPTRTASLTRRYTERWLIRAIRRHAGAGPLSVVELGGGNSFCCQAIARALPISRYDVADYNEVGLSMFRRKAAAIGLPASAVKADLLMESPALEAADVVFSVGLVEHFAPAESRKVAARHFDLVRPGGIVIITAPTPTAPYRLTRMMAERLGVWRFPDERPMTYDEVDGLDADRGERLRAETLWPLVLTQRAVVWRVKGP